METWTGSNGNIDAKLVTDNVEAYGKGAPIRDDAAEWRGQQHRRYQRVRSGRPHKPAAHPAWAELLGGGELRLSDSGDNLISGTGPDVTLTNVDNTISGAGQLGNGQPTPVNEGTIDATGANALVIDTGTNTVLNDGTLESSGIGGLAIHNDVVNTGIRWANSRNFTVDGNVSGSGSALISGSATLEFGGSSSADAKFDFSAIGTLKLDHSFSGPESG